jgi:3-hydroxyisobutyrate dehydrogenase
LIIDHSTIAPEAEADFARRLDEAAGAQYLDAPVSGGDSGARAGTLSIMAGGPAAAFERARPLLEAMGRTIIHIGERPGDGQRAKLVNQLVVAINCLATTEALRLGEAMGLDLDKVLAAIGQGAAGSWSLNNLGPKWLARDFAPGFRLRHLRKDLRLCEEVMARLAGDAADERFPGAALMRRLVGAAVDAGHGDENIHAVGRPFIAESASGK